MSEQNKKTTKKLTNKDKENVKKYIKDRGRKDISEAYFEKNGKKRWI